MPPPKPRAGYLEAAHHAGESAPSIGQLQADCKRLIDQLARKPYGLKLLLGVRAQLEIFLGYKIRRSAPPITESLGGGEATGGQREQSAIPTKRKSVL